MLLRASGEFGTDDTYFEPVLAVFTGAMVLRGHYVVLYLRSLLAAENKLDFAFVRTYIETFLRFHTSFLRANAMFNWCLAYYQFS